MKDVSSLLNLYLTRALSFFGGIEPSSDKGDYIIIGVPLEATISYVPGTRFAPRAIREASANIEFFSIRWGVDLDDYAPLDLGDIILSYDFDANLSRIASVVAELVRSKPGLPLVIIGGEHTITYGVLRGLLSKGLRPCILVFDAHFDSKEEYMGTKLNHATVMRRIIESYSSETLYFVGVRAFTRSELEYITYKGIGFMSSIDVRRYGVREAIRRVKGWLLHKDCDTIYLSIDMDVFDPSYAPGVSTPEADGLEPWIILDVATSIVGETSYGNLVVDIVETNPLRDYSNITSILAAKVIVELLAAYFARRRKR